MTTKVKSIMSDDLKGVGYVTGMRGVGKSWFFGRTENPALTCYLDYDDGKGEQLHSKFHYAMYCDCMAEVATQYGKNYKLIHVYDHLGKLLDRIESGRYTYCFIDNIDPIEKALTVEVKRDPDGYGIGKNSKGISNAFTGAFGGPFPAVNDLVAGLINTLHGKGIRFVGVSAHVKAAWGAGGIIPNKYRPRGVERWQQMSILSLVVIPGKPSPFPPAAIVQKEALGQGTFSDETGYSDAIRRLPLRLPEASFKEIYRYLCEPADLKNPRPGEVPTFEETDPFSDKFNKEQLEYMRLAAQVELRTDSQGVSILSLAEQIAIVLSENPQVAAMPVPLRNLELARLLNCSPPEVTAALNGDVQ